MNSGGMFNEKINIKVPKNQKKKVEKPAKKKKS